MRKSFKILVSIIIMLVFIWGIIFFIDYNKCANLKMPIFVIAKETADDGGSKIYYGLGYKVKIEKNISAQYGVQLEKVEMYFFNKVISGAITDFDNQEEKISKDVVKIRDGKIENEDLIDEFISETANKLEKTLKIETTTNGNSKSVEVSFLANFNEQSDLSENTKIVETRVWLL